MISINYFFFKLFIITASTTRSLAGYKYNLIIILYKNKTYVITLLINEVLDSLIFIKVKNNIVMQNKQINVDIFHILFSCKNNVILKLNLTQYFLYQPIMFPTFCVSILLLNFLLSLWFYIY